MQNRRTINKEINIISIVTPSYNQGLYLAETISSVFCQNGDYLIDYVIVDGGSKDQTIEIIKAFEEELKSKSEIRIFSGLNFYCPITTQDPIIKCNGISYRWISEPDNGHAQALNKGFRLSIGNIMCWINSDDKYHNESLFIVADVFGKFSGVNWISGCKTLWDIKGFSIPLPNWSKKEFRNKLDYIRGDYDGIQQESTFWTRSIWEKSGGYIDESYEYAVDGELWTRFFLYDKLYYVGAPLGGYRVHGQNRAILNSDALNKEMLRAIDKMKSSVENVERKENYLSIEKDEQTDEWKIQEYDYIESNFKRYNEKIEYYKVEIQQLREGKDAFESAYHRQNDELTLIVKEKKSLLERLKDKELEVERMHELNQLNQFQYERSLDQLQEEIMALKHEISTINEERLQSIESYEYHIADLKQRNRDLLNSWSWRLTWLFRRLLRNL